jgi:hypothetical protein
VVVLKEKGALVGRIGILVVLIAAAAVAAAVAGV